MIYCFLIICFFMSFPDLIKYFSLTSFSIIAVFHLMGETTVKYFLIIYI